MPAQLVDVVLRSPCKRSNNDQTQGAFGALFYGQDDRYAAMPWMARSGDGQDDWTENAPRQLLLHCSNYKHPALMHFLSSHPWRSYPADAGRAGAVAEDRKILFYNTVNISLYYAHSNTICYA
ncbi:MAG: hypothetical protein KAR30_04620 [Gammaproteobacteria bacterium]|nr:hypothetical protein [Gammaproteobacteria bacterium]